MTLLLISIDYQCPSSIRNSVWRSILWNQNVSSVISCKYFISTGLKEIRELVHLYSILNHIYWYAMFTHTHIYGYVCISNYSYIATATTSISKDIYRNGY